MTRILAFFSLAAVLLGLALGGFIVMRTADRDRFAACRDGAIASGETAGIGGPFSLVDATGARVSEREAIRKLTLVYFGYTFCPDFCLNNLSRNAIVAELLAERGVEVENVFISIDPERDTPEQVGDFTAAIDPAIRGLTGTKREVAAAASAYRIYFRKAEGDDEFYLMDHSTFTYLMDPERGFLDFFASDVPAGQMAERIGCFSSKL